jgi:C4-dicarboxylate-specific signal transduction histidine kinase
MTTREVFLASHGLAFFGEVTASISHELKNVMATTSETSGLLGDLLEIMDDSAHSDADELRACGRTIIEEMERGFGVIRNLNRFAHSTDEAVTEVDLHELAQLVVDIAGSLSYAKKVTVVSPGTAGDAKITATPIVLEYLLYRALVIAFRSVDRTDELEVAAELDGDDAILVVSGVGVSAAAAPDTQRLIEVATEVGAVVKVDGSTGKLVIRMCQPAGGV